MAMPSASLLDEEGFILMGCEKAGGLRNDLPKNRTNAAPTAGVGC